MKRLLNLLLIIPVISACAAPAAPSPTAASPKVVDTPRASAPAPEATVAPAASSKAEFDALVARARQSNGKLRGGLVGYDSEVIREIEKRFEQRFGIKIYLENEPGHTGREIPLKVMQGMQSNLGIVDWTEGGSPGN